jgi:membrane-bound serine protease (ClpP class)
MVNKQEIVVRIIVLNTVYVLVAAVVLFYLELEWLLLPALIIIGLWGIYVYRMNVKVLSMPVLSMELEGLEGKALTDISENGKVKVRGEIWNARSVHPIKKGNKAKILKRDGILLEVEPVED